jgi:hypothetical protein
MATPFEVPESPSFYGLAKWGAYRCDGAKVPRRVRRFEPSSHQVAQLASLDRGAASFSRIAGGGGMNATGCKKQFTQIVFDGVIPRDVINRNRLICAKG